MAARVLLSSRLTGLVTRNFGRRTYSAAAAAAAKKEPVEAAGKVRLAAKVEQVSKKECSWMRDPKTGCWMAADRLNDVDAADLRARLLFSKKD